MNYQLFEPSAAFENSYESYIRELGNEERYPFPLDFDYSDFSALLKKLEDFKQGRNLPSGYVPSTTKWMIVDGEIAGVSNMRHYLNEQIREIGGHIGIGIRPSFRKKGLGKRLLAASISYLNYRGIEQVHIHCYESNPSSAKMILANNGILDSKVKYGNETVLRFVV